MTWPSIFILAYLMLGLQMGLGGFMAVHGAEPNLLLLVVVFVALNAPRPQAMLAGVALGAIQDLVSMEPLGLYAFAFGIVALVVAAGADSVEHGHPLTHLAAGLVAGLVTAAVVLAHGRVRAIEPAANVAGVLSAPVRPSPRVWVFSALYTAGLAPLLLGVLQRMGGLFGLQSTRRRLRG